LRGGTFFASVFELAHGDGRNDNVGRCVLCDFFNHGLFLMPDHEDADIGIEHVFHKACSYLSDKISSSTVLYPQIFTDHRR